MIQAFQNVGVAAIYFVALVLAVIIVMSLVKYVKDEFNGKGE